MVHRVAVGWCLGGSFGGRMYYPKADYLEEVKAITSYMKNLEIVKFKKKKCTVLSLSGAVHFCK